ncbi:hypothetical protein [Microbacterium aurantiacum]|uniref:hypothetical protein n=1 Tax=Microbacterium aurantiacum TaxID=162393 RepID=UPI001F3755E1|nr:hypothetical protein [Microbacterium aurantiacum]
MVQVRRRRRAAPVLIAAGVLLAVLTGCQPEPVGFTATPAPTPTASATPPAETSTPTETAPAAALPGECGALYSEGMRASLEAAVPPANDPVVTMLSSQNAQLAELLASGIPVLRCTWGGAEGPGIATTVASIEPAQADAARAVMAESAFGCESVGHADLCRIERRGITLDDVEYVSGEDHLFADGLWVATSWIDVLPEGYSADIAAQLWG